MIRTFVRKFFSLLASSAPEGGALYRRVDLIGAAYQYALENESKEFRPSSLTSAVDAELRDQVDYGRIEKVERGVYRFSLVAEIEAANMPPIGLKVENILLQRRFERIQQPEMPVFVSHDYGLMDARDLVASDLLKLRPAERESLFSFEGFAL